MKTSLTFTLLVMAVGFAGCSSNPPTDQTVTTLFHEHRGVFDKLHEMIQSDKHVKRVGNDVVGELWFDKDESTLDDALTAVGMTRDRYDQYMELLRQIGGYRVSVDLYDDSISEIGIYRIGNVAESLTVDVIFARTPPNLLVEDTVAATAPDNTSAFLHLGDSWYIHREHD